MLFHRLQAWNLAYAMYQDGKIGFQRNGFIDERFEDGHKNHWITPLRTREALEMFVLDDDPLLPGDLDIDVRPARKHLRWWSDLVERPNQMMGRYRLDEMRGLKGLILANLKQRGFEITESEFDLVVDLWKRTPERIRWAQPGALAGRRHHGWEPKKAYEIELEFKSAATSLELASLGIPTYAYAPKTVSDMPATSNDETSELRLTVAKFYFQNQVAVPAPSSFSDALNLRENPRIEAWRSQLSAWSKKLSTGAMTYGEISEQIETANAYIEGVPFRRIPRWASLVTLPAAFYHTFVHNSEWAHLVGIGLFAFEALRFGYGEIVRGSVAGPDPLEYKWLLVSNNE
jgi:hypothetical protein